MATSAQRRWERRPTSCATSCLSLSEDGEKRSEWNAYFSPNKFTGQRDFAGVGLYDYGARFYSPTLGRFLSADTIVPGAGNPQALNRYSMVFNNPLRYTDPTGHCPKPSGQWASANIICVAGFIPTKTSTGIGVKFRGDNRDFSSDSTGKSSRFFLWINVDTGSIVNDWPKDVHPTETNDGQVYPPRSDFDLRGSNDIKAVKNKDGSITLSYFVVCSHPLCNSLLAPDGSITFTPNKSGSFNTKGIVDAFPNLEAYHWKGGKLQNNYLFQLQNFAESERKRGDSSFETSLGMATKITFAASFAPRQTVPRQQIERALQISPVR